MTTLEQNIEYNVESIEWRSFEYFEMRCWVLLASMDKELWLWEARSGKGCLNHA
jgi:hypothetical protein